MDELVELVLEVVLEAAAGLAGNRKAPRKTRLAAAVLLLLAGLALCGVGVLLLWIGADTGETGMIAAGVLVLVCMAIWVGSTVRRVLGDRKTGRRGPGGPALSEKEEKTYGRTDSDCGR